MKRKLRCTRCGKIESFDAEELIQIFRLSIKAGWWDLSADEQFCPKCVKELKTKGNKNDRNRI
ncbi:MAG: hypothetical protein EHM45_23950 [Desulfobacteraceae bacterium]|nr:MAG: hypothetical protein EHM45_23950 [Desulfobacteraceae bacterium]